MARVQDALRSQLLAALAMLENAIRACPDALWADRGREPPFWLLSYHTLFWHDLYVGGAVEGFAPPEPFGLEELDPAGLAPPRVYTREELLGYLAHGRRKLAATLDALTPAAARRRCTFGWGAVSFVELLLYDLRHVQHGVGQLALILRGELGSAPPWVATAPARTIPPR